MQLLDQPHGPTVKEYHVNADKTASMAAFDVRAWAATLYRIDWIETVQHKGKAVQEQHGRDFNGKWSRELVDMFVPAWVVVSLPIDAFPVESTE